MPGKSGTKKKRRRVTIVIFELFFAVALIAGVFAGLKGNAQVSQNQAPHRLGELSLVDQKTGVEALAAISQLHGKEIDLVDGYVAEYRANGAQATLWVSVAANTAKAEALTNLMTEKINEGRSPFTNPTNISINGRKVYATVGSGQRHYYFQSGDKVIWLSVGGTDPNPILEATLSIYQ